MMVVMAPHPFSNGEHGATERGSDGKFRQGNQAAKGHGKRHKVAVLREAALEVATPEMAQAAMQKLYEVGMAGDVKALCEWLNRCGVKPETMDLEERLFALEATLEDVAMGARGR